MLSSRKLKISKIFFDVSFGKIIKIPDKMKKIAYAEIAEIIENMLQKSGRVLENIEFVVGVSRGGLFPAMVIATKMIRPLVIAYIDKQDNVYLDRAEWIRGKKVLLVDDIVRTGKTMSKIKKLLLETGASSVATVVAYYLAGAEHVPDYGEMIDGDIEFPWDE